MIEENPRRGVKRFVAYHLLSGLLRCPSCGYGMSYQVITSKGKKYEYYSCNQYANKKTCKPHLISKDKIESQFLDILEKIVNEDNFKTMMKKSLGNTDKQVNQIEKEIKVLEGKANSLKNKQDKVLDELLEEYSIGIKQVLCDRLDRTVTEIKDIENKRLKLSEKMHEIQVQTLDVDDTLKIIEKVGRAIRLIDDAEAKQKLVRKLVKKITLSEDNKIKEIHFSYGESINVEEYLGENNDIGLSEAHRTVSQINAVLSLNH